VTTTLEPGSTPGWLVQDEPGLCPCGCIGKRSKAGFVARTIDGGATLMRRAMFAEDVASRENLLQRIDPRVKLVSIVGLLVTVALAHTVPVLALAYLATVGLAAASGLPVGFFVRRVWLFVPIFTGIVVLPATLSLVTPGDIVVPLGTWFGTPVGLTHQGLTTALLLVLRVATSISLVVLLTLTTPWARLLAALRALLVPRMFIQVLGMTYRYTFHLLGSVTDMYLARKARTVNVESSQSGRAFVAASAGALFGKSHVLAEEVHQAMVSRGYTGDARTLDTWHPGRIDLLWSLGCLLAAAAVLGLDHVVR
jgi:cobalt ECF transporter T component CbiQ